MAAKKQTNRKSSPKKPSAAREGPSKSDQIRELLASGMGAGEIAQEVGCSRNLVYVVKASSKDGGGKKRGPGRPRKKAGRRGRRARTQGAP